MCTKKVTFNAILGTVQNGVGFVSNRASLSLFLLCLLPLMLHLVLLVLKVYNEVEREGVLLVNIKTRASWMSS